MRVSKGKSRVIFKTKETHGMSFWLDCYFFKKDKEPEITMQVSGEGHTTVTGRYMQDMTVEELGEFIKQAKKLHKKAVKTIKTIRETIKKEN